MSAASKRPDLDEHFQAEKFTDRDWQQRLTKGQYYVLRKYGTELPLSSPLDHEKRTGVYRYGNELMDDVHCN